MKNATPLVSMIGVLILAFLLDRAVGSIHSQPAVWLETAGRILAAAAVLWLASVAFGHGPRAAPCRPCSSSWARASS